MKLKHGIIGTGRATSISRGHAMASQLSENIELIGVYDMSRDAAAQWCNDMGLDSSLVYDSAEHLIRDADIISICTPNFAHTEYIVKCLQNNTNVLCEKPICSSTQEAAAIRQALESTQAKGMIDFNYRRMPGVKLLHDLVANGKLGTIYTVRHNMGGNRLANEEIGLEWRFNRKMSGTGAICDFGSHALDMLRYILGESEAQFSNLAVEKSTFIPQRKNRANELQDVENDDCMMVQARLSCGAMYSLLVCRVGTCDSRLEIVGSLGIAEFRLNEPDRIVVQLRTPGEAFGKKEVRFPENQGKQWDGLDLSMIPLMACAENVLELARAVREDREVDTSLRYGIEVLELVEKLDALGDKNQ